MRLTDAHIKDLTTPRYIWKIENEVKYIIDTHSCPQTKHKYEGKGLSETVNELNRIYHNRVARKLGFDLSLGEQLKRINRHRW